MTKREFLEQWMLTARRHHNLVGYEAIEARAASEAWDEVGKIVPPTEPRGPAPFVGGSNEAFR